MPVSLFQRKPLPSTPESSLQPQFSWHNTLRTLRQRFARLHESLRRDTATEAADAIAALVQG